MLPGDAGPPDQDTHVEQIKGNIYSRTGTYFFPCPLHVIGPVYVIKNNHDLREGILLQNGPYPLHGRLVPVVPINKKEGPVGYLLHESVKIFIECSEQELQSARPCHIGVFPGKMVFDRAPFNGCNAGIIGTGSQVGGADPDACASFDDCGRPEPFRQPVQQRPLFMCNGGTSYDGSNLPLLPGGHPAPCPGITDQQKGIVVSHLPVVAPEAAGYLPAVFIEDHVPDQVIYERTVYPVTIPVARQQQMLKIFY
jgi:hypothetical protein